MKYSKKSNGILLTSDPSKQEIAEAIYNLTILNEDERSRMEQAAYKIWEERFDATKNARKFCEYLESFNEDKNRKVVLSCFFKKGIGRALVITLLMTTGIMVILQKQFHEYLNMPRKNMKFMQ